MKDHRHDDDHPLDEILRRLLEPHPLTVERLVRRALAGEGRPAHRALPRLLAAAAGAAALVAVLLWPTPPVPPEGGPVPDAETETPPARISISNAEGPIVVSSSAGSKWIVFSGDFR